MKRTAKYIRYHGWGMREEQEIGGKGNEAIVERARERRKRAHGKDSHNDPV